MKKFLLLAASLALLGLAVATAPTLTVAMLVCGALVLLVASPRALVWVAAPLPRPVYASPRPPRCDVPPAHRPRRTVPRS